MGEYLVYIIVRVFGFVACLLPITLALKLGRGIGLLAYYFDVKHKTIAYSNIKTAFSKTKTPDEIKLITKNLFKNFGQNLIELLRLPLMNPKKFEHFIRIEGKEHIFQSLEQKKGMIFLAMHFGSWELASLSCAMFGQPYKVIVKPQKRFNRLDDLLNQYRSCGGSIVLSRGLGTREMLRSLLQNNEIVGMVMDQGGRDGVLVPFFGRQASMSVGAIRLGLKYGVPICFSIIIREKGPYHHFKIHPPVVLENTGDTEKDVEANLTMLTKTMENYIEQYPDQYMWFYKIWKYSKESHIVILDDGRTGHLRQSQAVAKMIQVALAERHVESTVSALKVEFKGKWASNLLTFFSCFFSPLFYQGRLELFKWFLKPESYQALMSHKGDFVVSCGSSVAAVNYLLASDQDAKSVSILKPGVLNFRKFDLVVLPQHDKPRKMPMDNSLVVTRGAPNLITKEYLEEQAEALVKRFSHLRMHPQLRIGVLIGGDTKYYYLAEKEMRLVINQLVGVAESANVELLVTTSRRTSPRIENMVFRELKKHPRCSLLISANRSNVPEAVGGILGLSDVVLSSGDSISMISEAASSGKPTIVFPVAKKDQAANRTYKHERFIAQLNTQGHIVYTEPKDIGHIIYDVIKGKIKTVKLDDNAAVLEAVRYLI